LPIEILTCRADFCDNIVEQFVKLRTLVLSIFVLLIMGYLGFSYIIAKVISTPPPPPPVANVTPVTNVTNVHEEKFVIQRLFLALLVMSLLGVLLFVHKNDNVNETMVASELSYDDVNSLKYYLSLTYDEGELYWIKVGKVDAVDGDKYLDSVNLKSFLGTDKISEVIAMIDEAYYMLTEVIFFYNTVTETELERCISVIHKNHKHQARSRMQRTKEYMFKELNKWLLDLLHVMETI
jgi:hypothetical protein